jgi:hypothetical protein
VTFCACGKSRKWVNVVGHGDEDPSLIEVVEDEAAASLLTAVSIARPS